VGMARTIAQCVCCRSPWMPKDLRCAPQHEAMMHCPVRLISKDHLVIALPNLALTTSWPCQALPQPPGDRAAQPAQAGDGTCPAWPSASW
jgi:hypothetical protein